MMGSKRIRILLAPEARRELFEKLLKRYDVKAFRELARVLGVSSSCVKKWRRGDRYIPSSLLLGLPAPEMFLDIKDENWGQKKGGKNGIQRLCEKYPPAIIAEWRRKGGINLSQNFQRKKKALEVIEMRASEAAEMKKSKVEGKLTKTVEKREVSEKVSKGRVEKRWIRILKKIKANESYFSDNMPDLNITSIFPSRSDIAKGMRLPQIMDEFLAEETGVHIGDGTLTERRNYFSVRLGSNELEYANYLAQLCFQLYNFRPKVFVRGSICGFEIYSKALFEFKKSLGLPLGEKRDVDIPIVLKESRNMKLISACIRGIFDTDGCVYFMKNLKHSKLIIASQSQRLIESLAFYLDKMGFEPKIYNNGRKVNGKRMVLYGLPMLKLWMEKIGTRNPKHYIKLNRIINGPVV